MHNLNGLLVRDIRWSVTTAGPSPNDNKRIELFLLGCKKAMEGNPCKGCFNSSTWDSSKAIKDYDPEEFAKYINKFKDQYGEYITIGGGEPTDQINNLIILCKELKTYGYHIILYTWRNLRFTLNPLMRSCELTNRAHSFRELLKYIDIVIDGEYKEEERLYQEEAEDGFLSSIGSGNQIVWDINNNIGYAMKDIRGLYLNNNKLIYKLKDNAEMQLLRR